MLTQEQLQKLRDLNYALLGQQQSQGTILREAVGGQHCIITPQDTVRAVYSIVVEMAETAGIAICMDSDDEGRCAPCNTIDLENACLNCPTLEAKR
jgi:hypothetical protein